MDEASFVYFIQKREWFRNGIIELTSSLACPICNCEFNDESPSGFSLSLYDYHDGKHPFAYVRLCDENQVLCKHIPSTHSDPWGKLFLCAPIHKLREAYCDINSKEERKKRKTTT